MTVTPQAVNPMDLEERYGATNYAPLPVCVAEADGAWVTDIHGDRYLDCLAGYSALNFGHCHERLINVAKTQLDKVTLTSRAVHHDQLGPFLKGLCELTGKEAALPMNSGAEAVESALKVARRWGYQKKGIAENQGTILVADGNFHGRTISIVSFSGDTVARDNYGPYTPGFRAVAYGDAEAFEAAIDDSTIAFLVEPIQGEAGVIVPPDGYLAKVREICTRHNVLMIADEIQSGLGRAGTTFACEHDGVNPDMYVLGKAIGGGIIALSAISCDHDIMDVLTPGSHGSTFGGNPLAVAVGAEVVEILKEGTFQKRAKDAESLLREGLEGIRHKGLTGFRVRGLWAGIDIDPAVASGKEVCKAALKRGIIVKDTHETTIRLSPPLCISDDDIRLMIEALGQALDDVKNT